MTAAKPFPGLAALLALLALGMPGEAAANSRLTIQNHTAHDLDIKIYSGGDSICKVTEKTRSVPPGAELGIGYAGQGKQRCKIKIRTR